MVEKFISQYGGSSAQPGWLPVIDIARDTSLEMLGFKFKRKDRNFAQFFKCRECGTTKVIGEVRLRNYLPKTCRDCLWMFSSQENKPLRHAWDAMKARCGNPDHPEYKHYGARGIKVCNEWLRLKPFMLWAIPLHQKGLTLERIDVNQGYSPENCRWATWHDQARNKRTNVFYTLNGKTQCAMDWALEIGVSYSGFRKRVKKWGFERAITESLSTKNSSRHR